MKKFLIGVVTGLIVAGLTTVVLILAAIRLGGDVKPTIADGSTLVLRLAGEIPEKAPAEIPIPFLDEQQPVTVIETWSLLRRAASDPKIKALAFMPGRLSVGWAKVQQLREDLANFKKSGKPIYAYLRAPGTRELYLATIADKVYGNPTDLVDVKGMRAELTYYKGTLDKLGIAMEFEHAGKYKDAPDSYIRTTMTPETREVMNSVLDTTFGHVVDVLSAARKKTPDEMRAIIDRGPFTAKRALGEGLIDGTIYEDQFFDEIKAKLGGGELKRVAHRDYLRAAPAPAGKTRVAFLVGEGAITRGGMGFGEDEGITATGFIKAIRQVAKDDSIKAAILRVDSPGGDANASDDILREVKLLSKRKPLVISMSDVAASGGYYIAMSGDPVLAYPGTYTGSIGVFFGKPTLRGFYDKIGMNKEILKRGKFADIDSDYVPLGEGGRKKLREGVEETYQTFLGVVGEGRKRKPEEIDPLAQGRVWLGTQAKENALIDRLGGIDAAIEVVKEKAKIPAGEKVQLVLYPAKKSFFEQFMSRGQEQQSAEVALFKKYLGVDVLPLLQGGMLEMMPYRIDVR